MFKKFVLSAGNKIRNLARAGRLHSRRLFGRRSKEQLVAEELSLTSEPFPGSGPEQGDSRAGRPPRKRKRRGSSPAALPVQETHWSIDQFAVDPVPGKSRFHDFALPAEVMHAVADLDFRYCTPIQEKALPEVLEGHDLIGKAQTGTGKSAVFLIAVLTRLLRDSGRGTKACPGALIIAPTRELVVQIARDGVGLAKYAGVHISAVYGGTDYQAQMDDLRRGRSEIVVATPGRLLDFLNKGVLSLDNCGIMVIDEADRMLDMGFIPDVRRIIGRMPKKELRQTMLFSATVSEDVRRLAAQWCVEPRMVEAEEEQVAEATINQVVYLVTADEKFSVLYNLIAKNQGERIIVFTNMKSEAKRLSDRLQRSGIDCLLLSGEVPQAKRTSRLESFRSGRVNVLVATDVAGRGIHIEGITYVVNYTLPYEPEDYVHRIGRTGRAGAVGTSVSFACEEGAFYLPAIEEYIGRKLECVVPEEWLLEAPPKKVVSAATDQAPQSAGRKPPRKRSRRPSRGGGAAGGSA